MNVFVVLIRITNIQAKAASSLIPLIRDFNVFVFNVSVHL